MAMPVESKGADLRGQADQLTKFSLAMSHYGKLEVVGDSEPTMKSLRTVIKTLRQGLGLEMVLTFSQKKGRTGCVERAIQTLRRQASALVTMAEDRCLISLPGDDALWSWAYVHAAWVINRFNSRPLRWLMAGAMLERLCALVSM